MIPIISFYIELETVEMLTMLVPDSKTIDSNITLLNEGHAQPDQACTFPGHMDSISWEQGLAIQGELIFGFGEPGDQGSEPSTHAPEDKLVSDLLEEFGGIRSALLDELDDLQVTGAFG